MPERINVTRSSMPGYDEFCEEIRPIWDNVHLTNMGPIHNRLKEQVREVLGVKNVELFVNGHLALYCAIRALRLSGEIITTPYTFASSTNAIVQAGCTPVYCDVKDDYTIDETKVEALITDKTVAILGVHVYGNICNVEALEAIAKRHGLKLVFDAAHAFGVEYKGRGIGTYGDISMFSFHATKVFHTIEGGCLCYGDESLRPAIAKERNFGVYGEVLDGFGTNAKMNEFQAAMGICNLRHLDEELALRKAVFERYEQRLRGVAGLTLLQEQPDVKRNYAYFLLLIDPERFGCGRDELKAKLEAQNVYTRKYFYPLVSENLAFGRDMTVDTPKAKYSSRHVLCLPMYAHLALEDVDRICDLILA